MCSIIKKILALHVKKLVLLIGLIISFAGFFYNAGAEETEPVEGFLWYPYLEWTFANYDFAGNPFDLIASVTFIHEGSGETRKTEMFYDGDDIWKFRFTGTRTGRWLFKTSSESTALNGKSGTIIIKPNPNKHAHGFLKKFGSKWGWQGTETAFIPQFVMYHHPKEYYRKPERIDGDIQNFIKEHGFTGFHTTVFCRWFDINKDRSNKIKSDSPNPDRRTFQALEMLISRTHQAGGSVHIWSWGDQQRKQTPVKWSINGEADRRLQRYIAARLGPLPGWTMGYGFDLWEWVKEGDLKHWHAYMHKHVGWHHFLGGRASKNTLEQIYDGLDYSSYEQHRPNYQKYVETIDMRPHKPSFSEDRFRIQRPSNSSKKDYSPELVRRGLWHSAMAGGVANIWGDLTHLKDPLGGRFGKFFFKINSNENSKPFPNKDQIKTYAVFMNKYFRKELVRLNRTTDGLCLASPQNFLYIFYKENTDHISIDITNISGSFYSVAIDTKKKYAEIIVDLNKTSERWNAPYKSDWALAVELVQK
jgi:hypothetical protein